MEIERTVRPWQLEGRVNMVVRGPRLVGLESSSDAMVACNAVRRSRM